MTKRNLIIDCQLLQTDAWFRGMGKYSLQLIQSLSEGKSADFKITLVFNKNLTFDKNRLEVINYLCPKADQLLVTLPIPKSPLSSNVGYKAKLTALVDKNFNNQENYFILTSLFSFDFYAEYPKNTKKLLLFYDLTPLFQWKDLGGYFPPHLYMKRFSQILEADHIFSISETTKIDLLTTFGLEKDKVTNIDGGYTRITSHHEDEPNLKIGKKYILFPTGNLPHKNNKLAIEGFKIFNKKNHHEFTLVITSNFSQKEQDYLAQADKHIIFTGNVSDQQLDQLYEDSTAVLFASKYEGLGIPILDAVEKNKPVIASRISVFEEMTKSAFYFFDPESVDSLAKALEVSTVQKVNEKIAKEYKTIIGKYTWVETKNKFLKGLWKVKPDHSENSVEKKKIAIVCTHPGFANQIGRLAEPLYQQLRSRFLVDFYFESRGVRVSDMERPTFLDFVDTRVRGIGELTLKNYRRYDSIVFILDDFSLTSWIISPAAVLPGILFYTFGDSKLENLRAAILKNQSASFEIESLEKNLNNLDSLYDLIVKSVESKIPTEAETIIRTTLVNSNLKNKLLNLLDANQ